MALKFEVREKNTAGVLTLRLAPDVAAMLDRALVDCPIKSKIINQCIRESLTSHGYARKTDSFSPAKK